MFGNIPHTRRVALLDSLDDKPREALERYLAHTHAIETRWLVLRVLGLAGSTVAIYPLAPAPQPLWTIVVVLAVYAIPSQLMVALCSHLTEQMVPSFLGFLRPLEMVAAPIAAPIVFLGRVASRRVREGREDVDTIAHSLAHIRQAVGEAASRAEEIFHGADEQTRDVERMVAAMDELAKVAERNAVAIDGVVATSQRQHGSMAEMVASSATLTALAEELRGVLSRFETGSREPEDPA